MVLHRLAAGCLMMMIGSLTFAAGARASTIYTYDFTQGGYSAPLLNDVTGILTGSMSGTVDSLGFMNQADLTAFSSTFTVYLQGAYYGEARLDGVARLSLFSFNPGNGATTLAVHALEGSSSVCIGAAAAFGLCGSSGFIGVVGASIAQSGFFFFSATSEAPQITLVSPVATTPIPAALPLFASALGGLGLVGWRRRRAPATAPTLADAH